MKIHYLEIVTTQLKETRDAYQQSLGVSFSEPIAELGNACIAKLADGGMIGIRSPMQAAEESTIRPYWLVEDIAKSVAAVEASGAEIIHPPMEIVGYGRFAIYQLGGNHHALWQL